MFFLWTNDYFWAYKLLGFFMVVFVLLFAWYKQFFYRETVLLFTGKTLFFLLTGAFSEGPFLFVLYFLLYFQYLFFQNKIRARNYIFGASILMFLLFFIRYSGIYIFLAFLVYGIFASWEKSKRLIFYQFIFISGFGILSYLFLNFSLFQSFTGEHLRGSRGEFQFVYLFRDILGMTNVVDPFIGIKPASNSNFSLAFQSIVMFLDVFLLVKFINWYQKSKSFFYGSFHYLLWTITIIYSLSLFVSGLFQQIEEMNVRMLSAANFTFFFSLLILYFQRYKEDKRIFTISICFFIFLIIYSLKDADWFLGYKEQLQPQVTKIQGKKYLYNNEKSDRISTVYQVPFTNKKFLYNHTNRQVGELKQTIIGTINPQIKWLKYDTVKEKSTVLYTSELFFKNK
jgi:hypothetical protein